MSDTYDIIDIVEALDAPPCFLSCGHTAIGHVWFNSRGYWAPCCGNCIVVLVNIFSDFSILPDYTVGPCSAKESWR